MLGNNIGLTFSNGYHKMKLKKIEKERSDDYEKNGSYKRYRNELKRL